MGPVFNILAVLTVLSAVATISLRNLVHCALALALTFAGLAGLYLQLDAQFVGFAQILVYIGAVAILIVFAILLTRGAEAHGTSPMSKSWLLGGVVALGVFGVLARVILSSRKLGGSLPTAPGATVRQIGDELMTRYVLPLEVLGLLLTASLIGAVIIAMREEAVGAAPKLEQKAQAGHETNGAEQDQTRRGMEGLTDGTTALSRDTFSNPPSPLTEERL